MKITVIFHGILADFISTKRADVDLPAGAIYADLLTEIGQGFSRNMPDRLWNKEQNAFKAAILATRDERHLTSMEMKAPLIHSSTPINLPEQNQSDQVDT